MRVRGGEGGGGGEAARTTATIIPVAMGAVVLSTDYAPGTICLRGIFIYVNSDEVGS